MESSILRGDLAPDSSVAPSRHSFGASSEGTRVTETSPSARTAKRRRSNSTADKVVPWATRAHRSCDERCGHADKYCFFPAIKDGRPYTIPFVLGPDDILSALDPLGRVVQLKATGAKPKIQEAVERFGCDTSVFKQLASHNTVWYKMLFSMVHPSGDNKPEPWKCVRETPASLHIQPGLPPNTNDLDETWKPTIMASKKLFDSRHASAPLAVATDDADRAPSTSGGAANDTTNALALVPPSMGGPAIRTEAVRSVVRKRMEERVSHATSQLKTHYLGEIERLQAALDVERDLTDKLRKQVDASQKESAARQERGDALAEEIIVMKRKHDVLEREVSSSRQHVQDSFTQDDLTRARHEGYELCLRSLEGVL